MFKSGCGLMLFICFLFIAMGLVSCKKYLDAVRNKALVVPANLADVQALLDNTFTLNETFPSMGGQSEDNYYITDAYYNTLDEVLRRNYTWDINAENLNAWRPMYACVMLANLALESLEKITPSTPYIKDWYQLKGSALFFRAFANYHTVQYYAQPYQAATAKQSLGIPLKKTSSINEPTLRASLEESYAGILDDLQEAASLLPVVTKALTRPSKPAAYAALARVCLDMDNYQDAKRFADSSLRYYSTLLDYNNITPSPVPFKMFNAEVLFHCTIYGSYQFSVAEGKVDSILYRSYDSSDLRKTLFFEPNGPGTYGFKGDYGNRTDGANFNGLAVDEVYLVRAESKARLGDKDGALADLNTLLVKRWKSGKFIPFTSASATGALTLIITERRKELVGRQLRWFDLRRLNKEPAFAKTLVRKVNGQLFTLPPNDPRYTFYIPDDAIIFSGIQQNVR